MKDWSLEGWSVEWMRKQKMRTTGGRVGSYIGWKGPESSSTANP